MDVLHHGVFHVAHICGPLWPGSSCTGGFYLLQSRREVEGVVHAAGSAMMEMQLVLEMSAGTRRRQVFGMMI